MLRPHLAPSLLSLASCPLWPPCPAAMPPMPEVPAWRELGFLRSEAVFWATLGLALPGTLPKPAPWEWGPRGAWGPAPLALSTLACRAGQG